MSGSKLLAAMQQMYQAAYIFLQAMTNTFRKNGRYQKNTLCEFHYNPIWNIQWEINSSLKICNQTWNKKKSGGRYVILLQKKMRQYALIHSLQTQLMSKWWNPCMVIFVKKNTKKQTKQNRAGTFVWYRPDTSLLRSKFISFWSRLSFDLQESK